MIDKFPKRLSKKSRRGFRGWPMATIAFYGPNLSRASKVAVGIIHGEDQEPEEMRSWTSDTVDVRHDNLTAQEILEFIDSQGVKSVVMSDGIMGCPHQQGIDYTTEWCPECDFWKGRDRFTGKRLS
jgi:hypothetical protein